MLCSPNTEINECFWRNDWVNDYSLVDEQHPESLCLLGARQALESHSFLWKACHFQRHLSWHEKNALWTTCVLFMEPARDSSFFFFLSSVRKLFHDIFHGCDLVVCCQTFFFFLVVGGWIEEWRWLKSLGNLK